MAQHERFVRQLLVGLGQHLLGQFQLAQAVQRHALDRDQPGIVRHDLLISLTCSSALSESPVDR